MQIILNINGNSNLEFVFTIFKINHVMMSTYSCIYKYVAFFLNKKDKPVIVVEKLMHFANKIIADKIETISSKYHKARNY